MPAKHWDVCLLGGHWQRIPSMATSFLRLEKGECSAESLGTLKIGEMADLMLTTATLSLGSTTACRICRQRSDWLSSSGLMSCLTCGYATLGTTQQIFLDAESGCFVSRRTIPEDFRSI